MDPVPAIELEGLGKRHGRTEVLRGVTLAIRPGERVALIGPNGAGKSTLFDLISGRQLPSSGRVKLQGRRIDGLPAHRIQRLGLSRSFQLSQLFARLSVADHLRASLLGASPLRWAFWRRLSAIDAIEQRVDSLLDRLRLQHRRDLPAAQLSYAEQRALELGMTVAGGAKVILLDEPTAGMSRSETAHFVALIRELSAGRTLLTVEHDMGVVFGLADRIAVLVQGELIAFDTPAAVRADARVQQAYLGALPPGQRDD